MRFEWEQNKDAANRSKHGVGFDEAASVFQDQRSRTVHDPRHSDDEDRYLTLGFFDHGRLLVVWHTDREISKYTHHFKGEVRMVVLDQDISARFPDSAAVNDALRSYLASPPAQADG